ncbi:MAG: hypothetical protein NC548_35585 [Lachnospiraceae bacterium]|nr:hypothetical protein [Lachnospiraceae bacterium]MCM1232707.1 hypothetical protein [Ruminococcus flavefaciens]
MAQFKFGNFNFPDRLVKQNTVSTKPNQRQSIDAYTDDTGVTQDFALPHTKTEISFTTLPMTNSEFRTIMDSMTANYIDYGKRDANCTYYDDENGIFKTGHFYFDKSFEVKRKEVDESGVPTKYGEMTWLFIEY